jgi:uncharacterized membrane protein YeaQ/YmgE (transglycosylase-associated protein family)
MTWLWYILVGAVIGIIARLIHPGKENMGWIMTLIIGIVAAIIAKLIGQFTGWFDFWWIGFVVSIALAFFLIVIYGAMKGKK